MEFIVFFCVLSLLGAVTVTWNAFVRERKPAKPLHFIGIGTVVFLVPVALFLGGCGKQILEDNLLSAASEGNTASVERLVSMGVDINHQQEDMHFTPLMYAAFNGNTETVKALLRHHPDLNHETPDGKTAIGQAMKNGHQDIVRLLQEAGAR
jgi:hypothetical protein